MRVRNWLFAQFRSVARSFAFQEYDAPVLENTALFKRKGGEEITDQMYCFKDKDDPPHEVTLRPEMTPTLARMVLSLGGKILLPVKYAAELWRNSCAIILRRLVLYVAGGSRCRSAGGGRRCSAAASASTTSAVSYTHLTLPTIYSV